MWIQSDEEFERQHLETMQFDFLLMQTYVRDINGHLSSLLKNNADLKQVEIDRDPLERDLEAVEWHYAEESKLYDMTTVFCNGALLSIYAYCEALLLKMAREDLLRRERNLGTDEKAIREKVLKLQQFRWITEHFKANHVIIATESEWKALLDLQKVRDCMIHSNGEIYDFKNYLFKFAFDREKKGNRSLGIVGNRIVLMPEYCTEALEIWRPVLQKAICGIAKHSPEALERLKKLKLEFKPCKSNEPVLPLPTWNMPTEP